MFRTDRQVRFGPLTFAPTVEGGTPYEVAAQSADFDWADADRIHAFARDIDRRIAATIVLAWRAAVHLVAWTDVLVLVNGEWYQRSTGVVSSGHTVVSLEDAPTTDPAALWKTSLDTVAPAIGMLSVGLLAAQTLPNGGPLSVPAMTVVMESVLGRNTNLDHAPAEANRLRNGGWAIEPNPSRNPQRIRSGVAHHTPKDPMPRADEVRWMHQVAFAMLLDRLGLAP